MSIKRNDPTRYFSVVGPAFAAEHHSHDNDNKARCAPAANAEPSLTASWIVLIALLLGISVFAGEISILSSFGLTTDVRAAVFQ